MFHLAFYPENDVYHTAFRAISIIGYSGELERDAYRIFDYYSVFPFELASFRIRGKVPKRLAESYEAERPYHWVAEPAATLLNMHGYQNAALNSLVYERVLERTAFERMQIKLSDDFVPNETLSMSMAEYQESRAPIWNYLREMLTSHGLKGAGGLKDRTGLMEFQRDIMSDAFDN